MILPGGATTRRPFGRTPIGLRFFPIFRGPESLSHFTLLDQRERIVDVLHDDDALRRHASDDAIKKAIVRSAWNVLPSGPDTSAT